MEADHEDDADITERQQQAPSSLEGSTSNITLTSQVTPIKLQMQLKGLLKGSSEFGFHVFRYPGKDHKYPPKSISTSD
jgi:hypothetical protein